jgi:hypothetical protein
MTGYTLAGEAVIYPLTTNVKSVQRKRNPGCWIECSSAADLA